MFSKEAILNKNASRMRDLMVASKGESVLSEAVAKAKSVMSVKLVREAAGSVEAKRLTSMFDTIIKALDKSILRDDFQHIIEKMKNSFPKLADYVIKAKMEDSEEFKEKARKDIREFFTQIADAIRKKNTGMAKNIDEFVNSAGDLLESTNGLYKTISGGLRVIKSYISDFILE